MSKATEQIIKDLLQINPEKRLTATQVREQLKVLIEAHNCAQDNDHLVPDVGSTTRDDNNKWRKVKPRLKLNGISNRHKGLFFFFLVFFLQLMNDNDQVVPSMSTKDADVIPTPISRKRRRSSEKRSSYVSPRGITVEHVANDARQLTIDNIGQLQQLFRSNRNRLNGLTLSDTVRSTTPSLYSPGAAANHLATSSTALRLFPNRNNQLNASNIGRRTTLSNSLPPRVPRLTNETSTLHPNWRFLRLGNSMLNDLFRSTVIGPNPQASPNADGQSEQMRLIRRIRRAQSGTPNQSGR